MPFIAHDSICRCVYLARFGEALRITQDNLDSKNFYAFNPSFDKKQRMAMDKRKRSMRR